MRLVIVTGISGAGKVTALKIFEDNGYYCVDNLPIDLIESFADILFGQTNEKNKVAIGVDIRSGKNLEKMSEVLKNMKAKEQNYEILFLDCNNNTLIKRFKEHEEVIQWVTEIVLKMKLMKRGQSWNF